MGMKELITEIISATGPTQHKKLRLENPEEVARNLKIKDLLLKGDEKSARKLLHGPSLLDHLRDNFRRLL
jgi:hypothetical protein